MPKKDVNVHVKAQGAEQAKQELDGVAAAAQGVGQKTKEGGKQAGQATEETIQKMSLLGKQINAIKNYFIGMFGVTTGFAAVTKAIQAQTEAMRENAAAAMGMQKALLRTQFLGDYYKERPELRKEVMSLAEFGRRDFDEVANAIYNLRSKGAGLTEQQQSDIMREALEFGRTDPDAQLDTLVDMFSLYAKQTKTTDTNKIQNIIRETITQAGSSTSQAAQYMPRFLPIGLTGGLTGEEAAGIWSYITTQFADPAIATTGLRTVFQALEGKGTPDSQKLIKGLGINPQLGFFDKIEQLSRQQKAGNLGLTEAETIAQKEGSATLLTLLNDTEAMMTTIEAIVAAGQNKEDLTKKSIEDLFGKDELAKLEDLSRFYDTKIKNLKGSDINAVRNEVALKKHETALRRTGVSEANIRLIMYTQRLSAAIRGKLIGGWDPDNISIDQGGVPLTGWDPANMPNKTQTEQQININNDNSTNYYPSVGEIDNKRISVND